MLRIEQDVTDSLCPLSPQLISVFRRYFHQDTLADCLFLDIETTGLRASESMVYLIGCLYQTEDLHWHLLQFFCNNYGDELHALQEFLSFIASFHTLIHYNGKHFDLPFLSQCIREYRLSCCLDDKKSIDLYQLMQPCRRLLSLENMRQKTLEHFLGICREDRYNGGQLISIYQDYLNAPSREAQELLLLHNREDLLHMPRLLPALYYPLLLEQGWNAVKACTVLPADIKNQKLPEHITLQIQLPFSVPCAISCQQQEYNFTLQGDNLCLQLFPCTGEKKLFFPDYRNYFYIPSEDYAIHKSLGNILPSDLRQKATPQNCYQRYTGTFFPFPLEGGNKTEGPFPVLQDSASQQTMGYIRWEDISPSPETYLQLLLPAVLQHITGHTAPPSGHF